MLKSVSQSLSKTFFIVQLLIDTKYNNKYQYYT